MCNSNEQKLKEILEVIDRIIDENNTERSMDIIISLFLKSSKESSNHQWH